MTIAAIFNTYILLLVAQFNQLSDPIQDDFYHLEFDKIDNRVEVFLGDSLIFNSGINRGNRPVQMRVDIPNSLLDYSKELTVKLINAMEGVPPGVDIHWEIRYYLIKGGNLIDSKWTDADDGRVGVVFEKKYILD